jgi:colicin import membrane protein
MSKETSHLEFAPPQELGGGGSLALALFVHALLLMALTWGIHWRTDPQEDIVDAELWAAIPEPVALKSDAAVLPKNETDTKSTAPAVKKDAPPPAKIIDLPTKKADATVQNTADADIAIEKRRKKEAAEQLAQEKQAEKLRKAQELAAEKERKAELLREEAAKRKEEIRLRKEELAQRKEEELRRKEEELRRKEEEARRKEEEIRLRKEEEAKRKEEEIRLRKEEEARRKEEEARIQKEEEEARRKEEEAKRKEEEARRKEEARRIEQEAKEAEDQRQRQIKRLKSLGATTAGPVDPVNESKGGGKPSDSYLGRLRARVKPNITFSDSQLQSVRGNPAAEVEVTCSPSGQIIGIKLTQSSGNAAWDQAVLKAIEKTGTLPRDENGKIPSKIPFVFRPRD